MLIGIKVKTINDESFHFDLEHDLKIYDLKTKLKERTTIAEHRQRLIYKGRVLQDESVLEDYQIEEGHTIHMVARPVDYETLQREATTSTAASMNSSLSPSTPSLQTLLALSALSGSGAGGGGGLDLLNATVSEGQSLEAIRQGLLTTHTFMSMSSAIDHERCHVDATGEKSLSDTASLKDGGEGKKEAESSEEDLLGRRTFYLGQWLDVKDTVNQWLEATVMDIDYESRRVFVHYNGWPPRWDEWMPFSSDRVTPFRTRTANITTSQASPMPSNVVASAPDTGPVRGGGQVHHLVPELHHLVECMLPLLRDAAQLCERARVCEDTDGEDNMREGSSSASDRTSARSSCPWPPSSTDSLSPPCGQEDYGQGKEKVKEEKQNVAPRGSGNGDEEKVCPVSLQERQQERQQLARLTRELSPLLDRLGRSMTDTAPHLLNLEASLVQSQPQPQPLPTHQESNLSISSANHIGNTSGRSTLAQQEEEGRGGGGGGSEQQPSPPQSTMERLLESLSLGVSPLQRGGDGSASSVPPAYRPLVTSPAAQPGHGGLLGRGNGHVDIHIHAIVAPTRGTPSALGDSSSASTSISSSSSSPVPSPISTPPPPRPSSSVLFPSSTTISTPTLSSAQHRHSPSTTHRAGYGSSDDHEDTTPPLMTLLPEEVQQQQRRRQAWSMESDHNHSHHHNPGDTRSSPSRSSNRSRDRLRDPSSSAVRDDIEELYDANFGEHFRRLREDQMGDQRSQTHLAASAMSSSSSSSSFSESGRANFLAGSGTDIGTGPEWSTSESSGKKDAGAEGRHCTDKVDRDAYVKANENENSSLSPSPMSTTMPATYSKYGKSNKKIDSCKAAGGRPVGKEIDPVTLSNLEREVALLEEQTQTHQQQEQELEDRVGEKGVEDEEDECTRRKKNVSFVQRVRRSLSSLSSKSSSSSSSAAKKKKYAASSETETETNHTTEGARAKKNSTSTSTSTSTLKMKTKKSTATTSSSRNSSSNSS